MVASRSRWHDGSIIEVPAGTPGRQAALAFALYGLRLQAEGISPGPVEATITITDKHGKRVTYVVTDQSQLPTTIKIGKKVRIYTIPAPGSSEPVVKRVTVTTTETNPE